MTPPIRIAAWFENNPAGGLARVTRLSYPIGNESVDIPTGSTSRWKAELDISVYGSTPIACVYARGDGRGRSWRCWTCAREAGTGGMRPNKLRLSVLRNSRMDSTAPQ